MSYYTDDDVSLAAFGKLVGQELAPSSVPFAEAITSNVPVYDMARLRPVLAGEARRDLMTEWIWALKEGPGVIVLKNSFHDLAVIDRATAVFDEIIAREAASGGAKGDHFAAAGKNSRIWNALQKQCFANPEAFVAYHGNSTIDAVCEAWLGAGYQMTTQVNVVRPGGATQTAHRDYHLGFMSRDRAAAFPAHIHDVSPVLTLQGAIAHCDMPVESGPTQLLPFSQSYGPGYLAYHIPAFAALFAERSVQVPLDKGDVMFFSPALFHAAGENRTTDVHRMANLMQASSPMGRAMENVNRAEMCKRIYPVVQGLSGRDPVDLHAAIAATAEGYAFPTNLDTDLPKGGLAPETMAEIFVRCLKEGVSDTGLAGELDKLEERRNG